MRRPTQQEIDSFLEYRANHIALVQKLGRIVFGLDFSNHDQDKMTAVGKDLDLLVMRHVFKSKDIRLNDEDRNILRKVSAKHALNSKHHFEYWDHSITVRNFDADDKNEIHPTHIPDRYIKEAACDWAAVALYKNEPMFKWYNKVVDNTLMLTDHQKELLSECLVKLEKAVLKNNITYPGKKYDCKQILVERIVHKGSKWQVTDHTGKKNLGTYDTKEEAEERLKQVEYFKHQEKLNESYDIDPETLDLLNNSPTIKTYRAMQIIDGKLYPPMSAKVDGRLRHPTELGRWEKAEENANGLNFDKTGKFILKKGNGKNVPAAYNPYFHSSDTMLNDQFSEAQDRPNLVIVEVEIPKWEIESENPYKAEGAKDSVGKLEWKAGAIQSQLTGTRTVYLSRYDRPMRIVPDKEVAESIKNMLGDEFTLPTNVVTPSVKTELERLGIDFIKTDNRGRIIEGPDKGKFYSRVYRRGKQITEKLKSPMSINGMSSEDKDQIKKFGDLITKDGLEHHDLPGHDASDGVMHSIKENLDEDFLEWFGDSKVTHTDGSPKVVYHCGTISGEDPTFKPYTHFGSFDAAVDRILHKEMFFKYNLKGLRADGVALRNEIEESLANTCRYNEYTLYPVYLKIENPKRVGDSGIDYIWSKVCKKAQNEGFDGVVYENNLEGCGDDSYIIFDSNQVKVADMSVLAECCDSAGLSGFTPENTIRVVDSTGTLDDFKKEAEKSLKESIVDIPHKDYCSDVLTSDDRLQPQVRNQIVKTVRKWKDQIPFNFKVVGLMAKGSLLTKRYTDTSDLDVSIYTDMSKEQLDEIFDIIPKGAMIDGTQHPLDFYVLTKEDITNTENLDNIYDVAHNEWIKRTEEYSNELPIDYVMQACNFFINGCVIAINNYENDKILYSYYRGLSSEEHDISDDELKEILSDKKKELMADLDGLKMAMHMVSSFRHEAYDNKDNIFGLSIEVISDNVHNTINEQMQKVLEKFGIMERLKSSITECKKLLNID